jgi:type II secretory pathway component PulF
MGMYRLKILNKAGEIEEISREYPDVAALEADVRREGFILMEFKEKGGDRLHISKAVDKVKNLVGTRGVNDEDIYNFFYEMGIVLNSGVPLTKGVRMIIDETSKVSLRNFLEQSLFQLKEGKSFSDILQMEESKRFYDFGSLIPIIKMGEKTGRLGESFLKIADNLERWIRIRSEITNALVYPVLLIGTSLLAVYIMLVFVIPRFQDIVESFKVVLPLHTKLLFKLSIFLNANQELIMITLILALLAVLALGRHPVFRRHLSALSYKIPLVKNIKFASENIRFLNSLASLLSGGVPILMSMTLASESFTSTAIRRKLSHVTLSLRKGQLLADALKESALFPEIIPNMIRVGEESGNLANVLNELYNLMSQRFLKRLKRFMNLLEPLVIMFIAVFIGLLIMSILPIIMNLSDINF